MSLVSQYLGKAVFIQKSATQTDGQLLEDYIKSRDEAAFAALLRRHGPMVWSVCRRIARNHHDAEDAFQATFLVLIRKASSVEPRHMVANWLYGVAYKTSLNAKMMAAKRHGRERQVVELPEPGVSEQNPWHDQQRLIHEELNLLPDKYRVLIILCDLEGKSRKEAALRLGCPEGTVAGRLARARTMLARCLSQRGVAYCGGSGTLASLVSEGMASARVPNSISSLITHNLTRVATGQVLEAGMIPANVLALTEGAMNTMLVTKLKCFTVLLAALALTGTAGLMTLMKGAQESKQANNVVKDGKSEKKTELPRAGDDKEEKKDEKFPYVREHDFGEVKKGTILKHEFRIINTSNEPLCFNGIRRTMTGLTGVVDKEVLQPKEEGKLLVTFKTDKFVGKNTQTLYVTTGKTKSENGATYVFRLTATSVQVEEQGRSKEESDNLITGPSLGEIKPDGTAEDYHKLFIKTLSVIAEHFTDISHANQYDGRIEATNMAPVTEPSTESRRVTAEIRLRDGGGWLLSVRIVKGTVKGNDWVPKGRDVELEKRILRAVDAQLVPDEEPAPGEASGPGVPRAYTPVPGGSGTFPRAKEIEKKEEKR